MSQAGIVSTASGPVPPAVPTSFVTDSGTAVPAANILNVLTNDTTANNDNGIQDSGAGNTVTIALTNRQTGTVTTTDATPTTLISFTAGVVPTVYQIEVKIAAFDATDTAGASYLLEAGVRTTGAATVLITPVDETVSEEVAMNSADIDLVVTGNTAVVQVTGIAGKTIRWSGLLTFIQVI